MRFVPIRLMDAQVQVLTPYQLNVSGTAFMIPDIGIMKRFWESIHRSSTITIWLKLIWMITGRPVSHHFLPK